MCHCPLSKIDDEDVGMAEEDEMVATGVVLASVVEVDSATLDGVEEGEEPEVIVEPVEEEVVDVAQVVEIDVVDVVGMVARDGFSKEVVAVELVVGGGATENA